MKITKTFSNTFYAALIKDEIILIGNRHSTNNAVIKTQVEFGFRPIIFLNNKFVTQDGQFTKSTIFDLKGESIGELSDKLNLYNFYYYQTDPLLYNKSTKTYNILKNLTLKDLGFYRRIDIDFEDTYYRIDEKDKHITISEFKLHPTEIIRDLKIPGEIEKNSGRNYSINKDYLIIPLKDGIQIIVRKDFKTNKLVNYINSYELFGDFVYSNSGNKISKYSIREGIIISTEEVLNNYDIVMTGPIWVSELFVCAVNVMDKRVFVFDSQTLDLIGETELKSKIANSKRSLKFLNERIAVFDINENCYILKP